MIPLVLPNNTRTPNNGMEGPTSARKRAPPLIDEDGWRKAWQIKFKYGKSNNMSVWLIDRLTKSVGGRWLDMEEGRFELEWVDTANAWYSERQRRSKFSQSTHLLYKALQAAFPNIQEEGSEKSKHIFIKRSFKLPADLCNEVRQIVVGTGTKRECVPAMQAKPSVSMLQPNNRLVTPFPGTAQQDYRVDHLMKDFMNAVSQGEQPCDYSHNPQIVSLIPPPLVVSAWNTDVATEHSEGSNELVRPEPVPGTFTKHPLPPLPSQQQMSQQQLTSPPMSPIFTKDGGFNNNNCQEATFEQICEYAKQQLEIIHKWASEMPSFRELSSNDQKALLRSSAPELLVFSICSFSVQNNCVTDALLLDKNLVISRTNRQFETAIRSIVSYILDTVVQPVRSLMSNRYELSRLRRIILFNPSTKNIHHVLEDPAAVRALRKKEHILLQSHTNMTPGRFGELLLLLPPLTTSGNLFIEHLHLEKLVGDTFDNLIAAELLLAMGSG